MRFAGIEQLYEKWVLAGEIKDIFRSGDRDGGEWDRFVDFLDANDLMDSVRWVDGRIYLHPSFDPQKLEGWEALLYYLPNRRET